MQAVYQIETKLKNPHFVRTIHLLEILVRLNLNAYLRSMAVVLTSLARALAWRSCGAIL